MNGCGNYGVPVLDTTDGRVRVWYFDIFSTDTGIDRYAEASVSMLLAWIVAVVYAECVSSVTNAGDGLRDPDGLE